MPKIKFYVVWVGRKIGIFRSWAECQAQTDKYKGGKFKCFSTIEAAEKAFAAGWQAYYGKKVHRPSLTGGQLLAIGRPIQKSLSVDAAWNHTTGIVEFKCVETASKKVIFKSKSFEDGTNNMGEFIVIVAALDYCKINGLTLPIYSDSKVAIKWVKNKEACTNNLRTERNKKLFHYFDRAVCWLKENNSPNPILKWETKAWGENPADFGRK